MKFMQVLDKLQDGKCLGIARDKYPSKVIYWDKKSKQFKDFYTDEPYQTNKEDLFADDWKLFEEINYKTYKAVLRINVNERFDEIEHEIIIYENGMIEETGYMFDHGGKYYGAIKFDTPRKWASSFLDRYELREI